MDVGSFNLGGTRMCKPCNEERDEFVEMEAREEWAPKLAVYVECWVCASCGHRVVREDGVVRGVDGELL